MWVRVKSRIAFFLTVLFYVSVFIVEIFTYLIIGITAVLFSVGLCGQFDNNKDNPWKKK